MAFALALFSSPTRIVVSEEAERPSTELPPNHAGGKLGRARASTGPVPCLPSDLIAKMIMGEG